MTPELTASGPGRGCVRRRTLLAALGSGTATLSGCSALAPGGDAGDLERRVSLAASDALPDEHALRIDATVTRPAVTAENPAQLRIAVTNAGPRRALSVGTDGCALFNRGEGGSDEPPGLWLHRPARAATIERARPRWVRAESDRPRMFDAYGCLLRVFDAGESLARDYVVWDDYRVEGYLEPGTYRWETTVESYEIDDVRRDAGERAASPTGDPSATLSWGFALTVERLE